MDEADHASLREEHERAYRIAVACAQAAGAGTLQCVDCGDGISAERRRLLPSARRCYCCQYAHELDQKRQGAPTT